MIIKKIIILQILYIFLIADLYSQELPKIMYIVSKDGLNLRGEPSTEGKKVITLLYGERIIVHEKTNIVTIDGITDYWYETNGWFGSGYVFGGYLSENIPNDVDPILGSWIDVEIGDFFIWNFRPNKFVSAGYKDTDRGWYGRWNLNGDILTIETEDEDIKTTSKTRIEVINNNRIILHYESGGTTVLTRNLKAE
ncbi:hypothetical protein FACS189485_17130 [Spirochaetia bacterium]|nr:hypothetical protein FACS189485_17130 [Spirochaetia bacterium]